MVNEVLKKLVLQLYEVEKLSFRQIAKQLGIGRKTVSRAIRSSGIKVNNSKPSLLVSYRSLIGQWYKEYPHLKATQVYERLKSYGFTGSYPLVVNYTQEFRKIKSDAYYALEFLPGQEAQIDWFIVTGMPFGKVYGFIFVLSYSRYTWGKLYLRNSFEFFLDGHIHCFEKIKGVPHQCRYDNLKSVVLSRTPQVQYNPQFLDFSRFYGFSIYLCNPYSGHEKGRVERVIRDIRSFISVNTFNSLGDMNTKFRQWLDKRNDTPHRSISKKPNELFREEKLLPLPLISYEPCKIINTTVSPTGFVEFDTNKYSVPTTCSSKQAHIIAYPDKVVVRIGANQVATHNRSFLKGEKVKNPLHEEVLLNSSSKFKHQRILQLMKNMDSAIAVFLDKAQADGEDITKYAYQLFKVLKLYSRATLISAVREACGIKAFRIKTVLSILNLPAEKESRPVYPKDTSLLNIEYEQRRPEEYDRLA